MSGVYGCPRTNRTNSSRCILVENHNGRCDFDGICELPVRPGTQPSDTWWEHEQDISWWRCPCGRHGRDLTSCPHCKATRPRCDHSPGKCPLCAADPAGQSPAIPMLLWCPACGQRHIDEAEFAVKPHHTHACQCCGMVWRPALIPTVGVQFLPGFKNEGP